MPSRILRRSGKAVVEFCKKIDYVPDTVYMVGVGMNHQECDVMLEAWPNVRFVGFEPHPKTYRSIKDSYPGYLFPQAITDKTTKVKLYNRPKHKDGASLYARKAEQQHDDIVETEIDATTLDALLASNLNDIVTANKGLLWLDCEGSEHSALSGATKFLKQANIGAINAEFTGAPRCKGWCNPAALDRKLMVSGYYRQWVHTTRIALCQYDAIYVRSDLRDPRFFM